MADETETTEMVEQDAVEPQSEDAGVAEMDDAGTDEGVAEMERLRAALKRANAESAERRHKLEAYEKAEKARQEAELSEVEKAQQRATEAEEALGTLRADLEKRTIRHAVEMAATTMRFHDPADAFALADMASVKIDEEGKVDGVEAALKALAKAKPHLVRTEQPANLNASQRSSSGSTFDDDELSELAAVYGVRSDLLKESVQRGQ